MYNGKAAEAEIKTLAEASGGTHLENDLIRHNLVVFRGGENALQYLPPMGDVPPEARLNLVIHHLRHNEVSSCGCGLAIGGAAYDVAGVLGSCGWVFLHLLSLKHEQTVRMTQRCMMFAAMTYMASKYYSSSDCYSVQPGCWLHPGTCWQVGEAFNLVRDLEPTTPQEYILKGVVHACIGQSKGSTDHLKTAQQYFQLVGASQSECDTIPGRQCMASCFFLLKQFEDVLVFLQVSCSQGMLMCAASYVCCSGLTICNPYMVHAAEGARAVVGLAART